MFLFSKFLSNLKILHYVSVHFRKLSDIYQTNMVDKINNLFVVMHFFKNLIKVGCS